MIKTRFTKKENIDSGLGLLVLLILLGLWQHSLIFYKISVGVALIAMIQPLLIYPFTFLWLNISDLLGKIMSKLLLTIIFFVVLCPMAIIRHLRRKDSLLLNKFKKTQNSVFVERNHTFIKSDLINPF